MTDMLKVVALGICGVFFALVLKEYKPYIALCLGLFTAIGICLLLVPSLSQLLSFLNRMYASVAGEDKYFGALVKIAGISMLSRLVSDVCKDAGQQAASSAVTIAGRVICMCLCLPQLAAIFSILSALIPLG